MSFWHWLREGGSGNSAGGKCAGLTWPAGIGAEAKEEVEAPGEHTPKSMRNACHNWSFLSLTVEAVVGASEAKLPESEKKAERTILASERDEGAPEMTVDDEEPRELLRERVEIVRWTELAPSNRGMVRPAEDEPIVGLNSS